MLQGVEVLLLSGYFEDGTGLDSNENLQVLHDIAYLTRDGRRPFILGADFNNPPSAWAYTSIDW